MCTILSIFFSLTARKSFNPIVVKTFAKSVDDLKNLSKVAECSRVKYSFWNVFRLSLYSYEEN